MSTRVFESLPGFNQHDSFYLVQIFLQHDNSPSEPEFQKLFNKIFTKSSPELWTLYFREDIRCVNSVKWHLYGLSGLNKNHFHRETCEKSKFFFCR